MISLEIIFSITDWSNYTESSVICMMVLQFICRVIQYSLKNSVILQLRKIIKSVNSLSQKNKPLEFDPLFWKKPGHAHT